MGDCQVPVLCCRLEALQSCPLGPASQGRKWDIQPSSVWGIPLESLGKWSPRERQQRREMGGSLSTNKGQTWEAGRWSSGKVRKSEEFWYISAPFWCLPWVPLGLPWWLNYKQSACNAGDLGSIPGSGRSPREGNGYPLQYSCLENPMARGACWTPANGVAKSGARLSN